jgi:chemotaxis regulatin CheY-phosphate phosphatase CheZ
MRHTESYEANLALQTKLDETKAALTTSWDAVDRHKVTLKKIKPYVKAAREKLLQKQISLQWSTNI